MRRTISRLCALFLFCFAAAIAADAQATRTWVSGVGDDVNPCSRTAPCKTFAGALSKTAVNGEINCLDSAGFGALTITKSIMIDCTAVTGGVLASLVNGFVINIPAPTAGSVDTRRSVTLRGLDINGSGNGVNGVRIIAAANVHIEKSTIDGFAQNGITVDAASAVNLVVRDSSIRNNTNAGLITTTAGPANITVVDSLFAANATGIHAGAGATVRLSGNTIVHNGTGVLAVGSGKILSARNNVIDGNQTNGAPTAPMQLQ
jgi:hypothetical protein